MATPNFSFGASASPAMTALAPQTGGQADPFAALMQLLAGGQQPAQQGPDLGALLKQIQNRDVQGTYNKMNTLPSAAGGGPWNDLGGGTPFFKPMDQAFPAPQAPMPPALGPQAPAPGAGPNYGSLLKKPKAGAGAGFAFGAGR